MTPGTTIGRLAQEESRGPVAPLVLAAPDAEYAVQPTNVPTPASGQLLIKIEAAALNPGDYKVVKFAMFSDSYPITTGFDGAGVVDLTDEGLPSQTQPLGMNKSRLSGRARQ